MTPKYPYTVDNGSGEELVFLGVARRDDGERLEVEVRARPGAGPPMHVHYLQEEAMTVASGKLGYQVAGGPPRFAGPGETVVFPAGVAHKWWNPGPDDLRSTGWARPPHNAEYFLAALFASVKRSGKKRPDFFDVAFLTSHFRTEIAIVEIPAIVRKVGLPILLMLGTLLGKYDKYKDAPEAVRV